VKTVSTRVVLCIGALLACSDGDRRSETPPAAPANPPAVETSPADESEPKTIEDVARSYASDLARRPSRTDWGGGDAASGKDLYASHCWVCHGSGGTGDGLASVALNPKPRDFRDGTFYIDANANNETGEDVDLARVILEGPGAFGGSDAMQGWKEMLTPDDVRDLIAYIRTLSAGD
jgi:mono/diheme cytochrome c family protein